MHSEKIEVQCPSGHHVRGGIELLGKRVRCPRCRETFLFERPQSAAITDSGVMQILGSVEPLPPPPSLGHPVTRPCPTCGATISVNSHVCTHCSRYVGALPGYFRNFGGAPVKGSGVSPR
ncbi:hypothetical protein Poly41_45220 [Novipirellula artificiosorum]|uniref:Double zinc ribbon n=1 Tax=Novipirellula artificiosorum TaxID=2528016 RepID=A0A5C6DDW0_9BACT|nr:hypothetical protein Poly41_45220 [Novipirellula artificiosorum]